MRGHTAGIDCEELDWDYSQGELGNAAVPAPSDFLTMVYDGVQHTGPNLHIVVFSVDMQRHCNESTLLRLLKLRKKVSSGDRSDHQGGLGCGSEGHT